MSQENVEMMRTVIDAFNRRDKAAWLASRDPACEALPVRNFPEAGAIRGREAVWDFYVDVADTMAVRAVDADLVGAGRDKVLVHQRHAARGRTSGAGAQVDYWVVVTFREGRILRDEWFADRAEALEAAGLSE